MFHVKYFFPFINLNQAGSYNEENRFFWTICESKLKRGTTTSRQPNLANKRFLDGLALEESIFAEEAPYSFRSRDLAIQELATREHHHIGNKIRVS